MIKRIVANVVILTVAENVGETVRVMIAANSVILPLMVRVGEIVGVNCASLPEATVALIVAVGVAMREMLGAAVRLGVATAKDGAAIRETVTCWTGTPGT
jgi:hypothetical protein